jgi:allantoate deiminase
MTEKIIICCRELATFTEEPGRTTRTFLSPPMRDVHRTLGAWMERIGMRVSIDAAGNLRGLRGSETAPRFLIASHLDTVPNAGAFDGPLGVVMGIALVEALGDARPGLAIEVIGFSEEEGVRFGQPFIGSKAVVGTLTLTPEISQAIRDFGLDDAPEATLSPHAIGYLEIHIEQGPVLESLNLPIGVVEAIAGQSRLNVTFTGHSNHAGTTPMHLRHDALAAAAEWINFVESYPNDGLVATVGSIQVTPNATNVVPGTAVLSLDVRHAIDATRHNAVAALKEKATAIAAERNISVTFEERLDQSAVPMDATLTGKLAPGAPRMVSGAGHDAMIVAPFLPTAMLFLRSPGGISHHPDETVLPGDVAAAFEAALRFLHHV